MVSDLEKRFWFFPTPRLLIMIIMLCNICLYCVLKLLHILFARFNYNTLARKGKIHEDICYTQPINLCQKFESEGNNTCIQYLQRQIALVRAGNFPNVSLRNKTFYGEKVNFLFSDWHLILFVIIVVYILWAALISPYDSDINYNSLHLAYILLLF